MTEKTLWDYAVQERDKTEKAVKAGKAESLQPVETTLLVCGSKESGKSSLILRYMERDEPPKPSVGLDYIFGRKPKEHGTGKDVCHIWELGGGTSMTELLEYAINPKNVRSLSVLLVLDISKPEELWKTQETLLRQIKQRINNAIDVAQKTDPGLSTFLSEKVTERIGRKHTDFKLLTPFSVPLAIVGGRFDQYQDFDQSQKEMISKSLRFLANLYGATLMFYSTKADGVNNKGKLLIGKMAFDHHYSKTVVLDPNKPIVIPFGQDTMQEIGAPPIAPENLVKVKSGTPYDLWKEAFAEYFPPKKGEKIQQVPCLALDPQFAEAAVDSMRAQKDGELERYRKMLERKAKTATSNMEPGGRLKKK